MNYKKYFYKQTREKNIKFQEQLKDILEKEIAAQSKLKPLGDGFKYKFLTEQEWLDRVGQRFLQMLGDVDTNFLPKIWREVKKIYDKSTLPDKDRGTDVLGIGPKLVAEGLHNWVKAYRDYDDSVLCILEAPIAFPSGFYFQQVENLLDFKIVGARYTNHTIDKMGKDFKKVLKEHEGSDDALKQAKNALKELARTDS